MTFEKKIMYVLGALVILFLTNCYYMVAKIEEAGGMKAVIIEAGKEVKDISEKIAED